MTDTFHDTLTAEARAREALEHDVREIGEKLEDIKFMYPQLSDVMLTVSGYAMDLTGIRGSSTPPLPGGDALAMLGPHSIGYDEPDDLPHPAAWIKDWADKWREATRTPRKPGEKWAAHLAILQANVAWFIRQDRTGDFRTDIRAMHGRLASLTGNSGKDPEPQRGPEELQARADEIPDDAMLTRDQAEQCWPGKLDTTAWDRLRQRAKYHREKGENIPPRKYPAAWIRHEAEAA